MNAKLGGDRQDEDEGREDVGRGGGENRPEALCQVADGTEAEQPPQPPGHEPALHGALRNGGFGNRLAMRGFSILDAYIFGFILQELSLVFDDNAGLQEVGEDLQRQMADAYPHLAEVTAEAMGAGYDFAEEFRFGLDLIIVALERARDAG